MKTVYFLFLALVLSVSVPAQNFKTGEAVEIDQLMSSSRHGTWEKGIVTAFDKAGKAYTVKLQSGREVTIPSRNPEQWIRKATVPANTEKPKTGSAGDEVKEKPGPAKTEPENGAGAAVTGCSPAEPRIKLRIKEQVAQTFSAYEKQVITYSSFKKQTAYKNTDPYFGRVNTTVYPFLAEFTVDLVHQYKQGGQFYTEHKVWKFKRKYVLYTNTKGDCEFGIASGTSGELILSETK